MSILKSLMVFAGILSMSSAVADMNLAYTYGTTTGYKTNPEITTHTADNLKFSVYNYNTTSPHVITPAKGGNDYWQFDINEQCLTGAQTNTVNIYVYPSNHYNTDQKAEKEIFADDPNAYVCKFEYADDQWNDNYKTCVNKAGQKINMLEMGGGADPSTRSLPHC
jgi:hypothetical protein